MRVAELGKFYPPHPGGMEAYLQQCCRALSPEHVVGAFVFNDGRSSVNDIVDGITVHRAGRLLEIASQPVALTLGHAVERFNPDVVHLHWPNPLAALVCDTQLRNVPVVVTHHADITRQKFLRYAVLPLYRSILKRSFSVIVTSRKNAEHSRDLGSACEDVTSIPIGVDDTALSLTPAVERCMDYLRALVPEEHLVLGFVGRHVSYKGGDVLLQAIAKLPRTYAIIAGDGPLRETWQLVARDLGVADRVSFLGRIGDAMRAALYRAIDIFVLPSVSGAETFGIVQVEAQLCGCPIIASDISSGVTEVTRHGKTGLCVPPANPEALSAAIKLLAADPRLRNRLGQAGLNRARALYTAAAVEDRLREHFRSLERRIAGDRYA